MRTTWWEARDQSKWADIWPVLWLDWPSRFTIWSCLRWKRHKAMHDIRFSSSPLSYKTICNSSSTQKSNLGGTSAEAATAFLSSFPLLTLTSCGLTSTLLRVHTSRRSLPLPRPQETHLTFSPGLPHPAFPFLPSPPETRASQLSLAS